MQGIVWILNKNGEALAAFEQENSRLKAENDQLKAENDQLTAQLAEQTEDKHADYERADV